MTRVEIDEPRYDYVWTATRDAVKVVDSWSADTVASFPVAPEYPSEMAEAAAESRAELFVRALESADSGSWLGAGLSLWDEAAESSTSDDSRLDPRARRPRRRELRVVTSAERRTMLHDSYHELARDRWVHAGKPRHRFDPCGGAESDGTGVCRSCVRCGDDRGTGNHRRPDEKTREILHGYAPGGDR